MYAIIKSGGKQYKVSEGDKIDVDLLEHEEGSSVKFPEVLFVSNDSEYQVGKPSVEGFTVEGQVIGESAAKKLSFMKKKRRKRQNKKYGHRQHYTTVIINKIGKS